MRVSRPPPPAQVGWGSEEGPGIQADQTLVMTGSICPVASQEQTIRCPFLPLPPTLNLFPFHGRSSPAAFPGPGRGSLPSSAWERPSDHSPRDLGGHPRCPPAPRSPGSPPPFSASCSLSISMIRCRRRRRRCLFHRRRLRLLLPPGPLRGNRSQQSRQRRWLSPEHTHRQRAAARHTQEETESPAAGLSNLPTWRPSRRRARPRHTLAIAPKEASPLPAGSGARSQRGGGKERGGATTGDVTALPAKG